MINNKEKKFMSAVVYLHNNENQIEKFLTIVLEVFERNYERYEIILVDDASSDNTVRKVHDIAEKSTGGVITVVNMSFFQGLEKSMNAGVDLAIGDFVYEFDTVEIDYDPKLIMDIYYKAQEGFDIVAISNKNEKLSSKLFYYVFNLNNKNKIVTQTFSIISRRAINRVKSNTLTIPYRKAVYQNSGLATSVIFYNSTNNNIKNITDQKSLRFDNAITSIILYTNHTYKFAMFLAILMMLLTFLGVIYSIIVYSIGKPIEGYTTTMLVMTSSFCALFILIAIVIKYADIILNLMYKKQSYLIKSVDKLSNRGDL
jgi:glycosyltransferase involved in cell wall biosynthesis